MSHDAKEWCKIWRKTYFLFKNDKNLVNFDPSTRKSKKFPLWLVPFVQSMYTFDLKKFGGVIFHDTEESCKIWRKIDLWFAKWHGEFGKFSPEHLKVPNWYFDGILLSKVENAWATNLQRKYK